MRSNISFFDIAAEMLMGIKQFGFGRIKYNVFESDVPVQLQDGNVKQPEPVNVATIYTASKKLSEALSSMPIKIKKESEIVKDHKLSFPLMYRMNDSQNNQVFWSTLEYHRNIYGNAFVDIRYSKNKIIHPALISDYDFNGKGGSLRYKVSWSMAKRLIGRDIPNAPEEDEWIESRYMLHFKGMSVDGVFGLPPVTAAQYAINIMDKASNTIVQFYNNKAMSPFALESTISTASGAKVTTELIEKFKQKYTGTFNAGRAITLPPNTKLTPLQIHFADAELIGTMNFTKDEIFTMYGIPRFMYNASDTVQMDIEQQSLNYRLFTIAPIAKIYSAELEYKLLSKKELLDGYTIEFDTDTLIDADLQTKSIAYRNLSTAGLISPNEAIEALGFKPIESENGDLHYIQSQNLPIESYDLYVKDKFQSSVDTNNSDSDSGTSDGSNE